MLLHKDGTYDFPGGQMEWGETPQKTFKRELIEELAYSLPEAPQFLDIWNYISKDKARHSVFLYYLLALKQRPELQTTGEEAQASTEVVWLSKKELKVIIKDSAFLEKIFA